MEKKIFGLAVFLALTTGFNLRAQGIPDALRLAQPTDGIGARSAAMGNAFTGVADDFSALYWNPAGLGRLNHSDFSFGLSNLSVTDDATFLGSAKSYDNSTTHLNNIGLAIPFPVARGSLVFAAGFQRIANYTGGRKFDAFNPRSSIQPTMYDRDRYYDMAWQVGLEEENGNIPVNGRVQQTGDVLTSGSLNQWAFGGSIQVAPRLYLGLSLNVLTGSYRYERTLVETDVQQVYQDTITGIDPDDERLSISRVDFRRLTVNNLIEQDLSGWNATIGAFYNYMDVFTLGLTIRTPAFITVTENGRHTYEAEFLRGYEKLTITDKDVEYDVTTPWVFGFGAAVHPVDFATISADLDLTDFSETQFDNTEIQHFADVNKDIKNQLRATKNFRFGAEVQVPGTELFLRGGYGIVFSPYVDDKGKSDFNTKTISAGIGYEFDNALTLNATFLTSNWSTFHFNYDDPAITGQDEQYLKTDEKVSAVRLMFSLSYRF
jgi:long-subunit fatty acid transport protein